MTAFVKNLFTICAVALLISCNKKEEKMPVAYKGNYFSVINFAHDQWDTYSGQPIAVTQYITENGKKDSAIISALTMKWSEIFKTFFQTDISDPKFLEKYDFAMFDESTTQTKTFSYTAKNPDFFTQKLEISADAYNNKVRSVYIETKKSTFWNTTTQKLLYSPMHVIQILEHNDPLIGSQKEKVTEYKFM